MMTNLTEIRRFALESTKPGFWHAFWEWKNIIDPPKVICPIFLTRAQRVG